MPTFLDEALIHVKAGDGGAGAMHFRHEKYVPRGGPDGGDGGDGGSVALLADAELNTLYTFQHRRRFKAEPGDPGGPSRMHGRSGKDLVIPVPVGTTIRSQEGEVLGDLREAGQTLVVARGGKGGLGNVHFKSSTNQAPGFAEKGEPGEERDLELELRLIADVGIIGAPNAGKSTLLSVVSAARPKVADYPFTTLVPNLGVIDAGDYTYVAADIPGLIEGAHQGVGLGHEFLRHVERTLVLWHLVDGSGPNPPEVFAQVLEELTKYDPDLMKKPQIVVVSKMDIPETQQRWPELKSTFNQMGYEAMSISAPTHDGIDPLIYRTADLVREETATRRAQEERDDESAIITIKRPADYFEIERKRRTFHVTGETVERLAVMTDTDSDEAMYRLHQRLRRMGVLQSLQRSGARPGSKVRIGETEFEWGPSEELKYGAAVGTEE